MRTPSTGQFASATQFILLVSVILLGSTLPVLSQDADSPDELFKQARQAAFDENNYPKARRLAYRALEQSPDYHGIRVFVARTFAWDDDYETARKELKYVLDRDPNHKEALQAIITSERWSDNYDQALKYANTALSFYSTDAYFMNEKGAILQTLDKTEEARKQYENVLELHPSNQKAQSNLRNIKEDSFKYSATISYEQNRFRDTFDPWNFAIIKLSRDTPYGSITGEVQYANRFGTNGVQYSLRGYPSIVSGLYAYVNLGISNASIFPDYRFDLSLYKSLPAGFATDAGFRFLNFGGDGKFIYTGALSKYYGRYFITARTYVTPGDTGTSASYSLTVRKYFGSGSKRYFSLSGGAGSGPSDPVFEEDIQQLDSWGISASLQLPLNYRTLLGASVGYDSEDFVNFTRKEFAYKISFSYQF